MSLDILVIWWLNILNYKTDQVPDSREDSHEYNMLRYLNALSVFCGTAVLQNTKWHRKISISAQVPIFVGSQEHITPHWQANTVMFSFTQQTMNIWDARLYTQYCKHDTPWPMGVSETEAHIPGLELWLYRPAVHPYIMQDYFL